MIARYTIGYLIIFGFIACSNEYNIWLTLPPSSTHQWRQADGASLAWHYAQNLDFWKPEINNLFFTGDAHAMGEFPLLYWLSGLITHFFGWPAYPLRWIGLFLLLIGGWAFGWIILQQAKRPILAVLSTGLLLTSPILSFYGPSFLPDAPAFCFVLIMLACLVQADIQKSKGWLFASGLAACMAILLKISMAILPLALMISWVSGKRNRSWSADPFRKGSWPLIAFLLMSSILCIFFYWKSAYNSAHEATYFLATTRPIWHYDGPFIWETIQMIGRKGLPVYASVGLYIVCLASLWLTLKHWKKTACFIRDTFVLTTLGSIIYILLWFRMLREHDYYVLCLMVLPVLLILNGTRIAIIHYAKKQHVCALSICLILGFWHNYLILTKRLHLAFNPENRLSLPPEAFLSINQLSISGIPLSARILCPQDPSPNIALLALKRQGWSGYNFGIKMTADTLSKYQNQFGLTHLALRDTLLYNGLYQHFFPERVFSENGWYLYKH